MSQQQLLLGQSNPSLPLCSACSAIPLSFFEQGRHELHQSYETLQASAANGSCGLCALLCWVITIAIEHSRNKPSESWEKEIVLLSEPKYPNHWIKISQGLVKVNGRGVTSHIDMAVLRIEAMKEFIQSNTDDDKPIQKKFRQISQDPNSAATKDTIRAWLNTCLENHPLCQILPTVQPTRLIDVTGGSNPRLVETDRDPESPRVVYLTLSHCWGSMSPADRLKMTTTTLSLRSRMNEIPLESIPKTFRDAIQVTQSLGERYLWIDSLCIIQDSKVDWETESAIMGQIYANSLCTIAACNAENPGGGLFSQRPRIPELLTVGRKNTSFHLYPLLPSWRHIVPHCQLSTRGWTLQERQLSRRIIQYTKYEVFWECSQASASETSPDESRSFGQDTGPASQQNMEQLILYIEKLTLGELAAYRLEVHPGGNPPSAYESWYICVQNITRRDFTFESDILPAMAGISSHLASRISDTYIAGLWKNDVVFGLSWRRRGSSNRPAEWRAPSWSWASITGRIQMIWTEIVPPHEYSLEVLDAFASPISAQNPFGAIRETGTYLKVRGIARRWKGEWLVDIEENVDIEAKISAQTIEESVTDSKAVMENEGNSLSKSSIEISPSTSKNTRSKKHPWTEFAHSMTSGATLDITWDVLEEMESYQNQEILCLHLFACGWHGGICGLALVQESENGNYRRVGLWLDSHDGFAKYKGSNWERQIIVLV